MGHARALITLADERQQVNILQRIIRDSLNVRQVEEIVRKLNSPPVLDPSEKQGGRLPEKYKGTPQRLSDQFGTKVRLRRNNKGEGSIVISFRNDEELDHVLSIITP